VTVPTKQRSKYRELKLDDPITAEKITRALEGAGSQNIGIWWRNVGDGLLRVIAEQTPIGWHLAVTHAKRGKGNALAPGRWPKYEELYHARLELLPDHIDVVLHLPREEDYDEKADTTFHLHEYPDRSVTPQLPEQAMAMRESGLIIPGAVIR
jgi:hypothetical protein